MIVADASAVLEVLLNAAAAFEVGRHLFADGETLHAPHLIDIEVLQVLRRHSRTGEISGGRALEALQDYSDIPLKRYGHALLLPRIWELRHNFTAYDAAYIALAETLDAPLITMDYAFQSTTARRARVIIPSGRGS